MRERVEKVDVLGWNKSKANLFLNKQDPDSFVAIYALHDQFYGCLLASEHLDSFAAV